jgi:hypothetical protein
MVLLIIPPALTQNVIGIFLAGVYTSTYAVGALLLYKRLVKRVKPRYPLSFPDGVDYFFPRFDIPRPIYLDLAQHPKYFEKGDEAGDDVERWTSHDFTGTLSFISRFPAS